jgi:Holliday junction resolvasome RuvABC endonuclease subunit
MSFRVLGIDPSLTNLGYVVLEDGKVLEKGRFQTGTEDGLNLQRYAIQAARLSDLITKYEINHLATEAPFFQSFNTEVLFALQSILHLTYWHLGLRVVIIAPFTVKSFACPDMSPTKVMKRDMVNAARKQLGMRDTQRFANDEADALFIGLIGYRWWSFYEGYLKESDLNSQEKELFLKQHTYSRGKKKGIVEKKGLMFRENELFFLYDKLPTPPKFLKKRD